MSLRRPLVALIFALCPIVASAQNPTSMASGSTGGISSRFISNELLTRLMERPDGAIDSVSFAAPIDSVWGALKTTVAKYELPAGFEDRSAWQLGNQSAKIYRRLGKSSVSSYLRCGEGATGPNADNYVVYLTFLSVLKPNQGAGVALYTLITGQAIDLAGGRNDPVNCSTTGRFEQEIAKQVQKTLVLKQLKQD